MQPKLLPFAVSRVVSIPGLRLFLVVLVVLTASLEGMAVTFNVSPASVPNAFTGTVELKIVGVSPGASVRVEKYLDENGNGQIDAQEPLLESFVVTDGLVSTIGGITNLAYPGRNYITVYGYDNNEFPNQASQTLIINFQPADTLGPNLVVTSHTDGQTVNSKSITITGTASDAGRGDDGISSVS